MEFGFAEAASAKVREGIFGWVFLSHLLWFALVGWVRRDTMEVVLLVEGYQHICLGDLFSCFFLYLMVVLYLVCVYCVEGERKL